MAGRMETPHGGEQRRRRQLLGRPGRAERNPGRAESAHRAPSAPPLRRSGLVTARGDCVQAALVPRDVERMVASVTLLVVRTHSPEFGMGHYLWYFLTSSQGQAQLQRQLTVSPSVGVTRDLKVVRQQPLRSKTVCPVGAKTEPDCQVGRGSIRDSGVPANPGCETVSAGPSENPAYGSWTATLKAARIGRAAIRELLDNRRERRRSNPTR